MASGPVLRRADDTGGEGPGEGARPTAPHGTAPACPTAPHGVTPARARLTVAVLCYVNLLNYMDRFTVASVLPDVEDFFGIGDSSSGLLQTAFISSYMVLAPVFGYLGDRHNRKRLLCLGIALWSAVTLASSFVPREPRPGGLLPGRAPRQRPGLHRGGQGEGGGDRLALGPAGDAGAGGGGGGPAGDGGDRAPPGGPGETPRRAPPPHLLGHRPAGPGHQYVVAPPRRSTAEALQIVASHLLGDAGSPYLIGVVSDALRAGSPSFQGGAGALGHALLLCPFAGALGGGAFLAAAAALPRDRRRAQREARGLPPDDDDDDDDTGDIVVPRGGRPTKVPVAHVLA